MRFYIYFILIGLVFLSSCREDELIPIAEGQTEISNPTEIELGVIEGNIRDIENNFLEQVTVDLYDENDLIESQQTDNNGYFQFIVEEFKDYYVHVHSNIFSQTIFEINPNDSTAYSLMIELLPAFIFGGNTIQWGNTEWIKLDGYIYDDFGQGVDNVKIIASKDFGQIINYTCSNELGFFEILVPRGSEIDLEIYSACGYANEIPFVSNINEDTTLEPIYLETIQEHIEFTGTVTDCNGLPIEDAELIFEFRGFSKLGNSFQNVQVTNGSYTLDYISCEEVYQIYVYDANTGLILQDIYFNEWENNSEFEFDFELCDVFLNLISTMEISVDGQTINTNSQYFATYDGDLVTVIGIVNPNEINFSFSFAYPNLPIQNPLYTNSLVLTTNIDYYFQEEPLELSITDFPDQQVGLLEGDINGLVIEVSTGLVKNFECHFEVILFD